MDLWQSDSLCVLPAIDYPTSPALVQAECLALYPENIGKLCCFAMFYPFKFLTTLADQAPAVWGISFRYGTVFLQNHSIFRYGISLIFSFHHNITILHNHQWGKVKQMQPMQCDFASSFTWKGWIELKDCAHNWKWHKFGRSPNKLIWSKFVS